MLATLAAVAAVCAGGDLPPSAPVEQLKPAARCLVNRARERRDLRPLRGNARVAPAAWAQVNDMREHDYFAHERPGWTFEDRVDATDSRAPVFAEVLECGCGGLATPAAAVEALLDSREHREILLDPLLRRMAIAVIPWMHGGGDCPDQGTWAMVLTGPA